jgi:hypothetical protein
LLDYFDKDAGSTELRVTFDNCLFDQNQYAGEPGQDALVVGNSQQNRLVFEKCQFTNNDMIVNNRDVSIVLLFGYAFCFFCCAACCMLPFECLNYQLTTMLFGLFACHYIVANN